MAKVYQMNMSDNYMMSLMRQEGIYINQLALSFSLSTYLDQSLNMSVYPTTNTHTHTLYMLTQIYSSSVHAACITLNEPTKMVTPYGGRLTWTLPGNTKLIVHLKDKNKIRHKKRWSQCMYMYYLLGYRLVGMHEDSMFGQTKKDKHGRKLTEAQFLPYNLFRYLPEHVHKRVYISVILLSTWYTF